MSIRMTYQFEWNPGQILLGRSEHHFALHFRVIQAPSCLLSKIILTPPGTGICVKSFILICHQWFSVYCSKKRLLWHYQAFVWQSQTFLFKIFTNNTCCWSSLTIKQLSISSLRVSSDQNLFYYKIFLTSRVLRSLGVHCHNTYIKLRS